MLTGSLSRRAGGLFQSVRHLSNSLAQAGLKVSVIGLRDVDTDSDLDAWLPLKPVVLEPEGPRSLGLARGLDDAIRLTAPHIVHQHGLWMHMSRVTASWAHQLPTVISPRGMLDEWALENSRWKKRLAWHLWEKKNLHRATCIHALAHAEATAIKAVLPDATIAVLPNAVAVPQFATQARDCTGTRELLFLGRIHPKKGLDGFLVQWSRLPLGLKDNWRVTVAGPDERGHRLELEQLAHELGIANQVNFVGPLSGPVKEEALMKAHAFVLPSHSEGLPMAVLEAWAYALPVLMTKACNLPEGFAADAAAEIDAGDNPSKLVQALSRQDLPEMGQRGRALVQNRFTWERVAGRYCELYEWMINEAPRPGDILV